MINVCLQPREIKALQEIEENQNVSTYMHHSVLYMLYASCLSCKFRIVHVNHINVILCSTFCQVVKLIDVFPYGTGFVLVFEYMLSDLSEVLRNSARPLTEVCSEFDYMTNINSQMLQCD